MRRLTAGPSNGQVLDPWFRLTEAYVPRRYDGSLTIFLSAAENSSRVRSAAENSSPVRSAAEDSSRAAGRGWPALAPHVDVHRLRGTHITCITDFIGDTADMLGEVLAAEP
jgi:hypothetical protein